MQLHFLSLAPFSHSLLSDASSLALLLACDVKHLGNSVCQHHIPKIQRVELVLTLTVPLHLLWCCQASDKFWCSLWRQIDNRLILLLSGTQSRYPPGWGLQQPLLLQCSQGHGICGVMLETVGTGPAKQSSSLGFACKANKPRVLLTASVLPLPL